MEKYFLKEKDFIGGHDLNICDLIASATLEQSMLAGYESSPAIREYLNRCGEKIPQYHEILKELKETPGMVKKLEAKFNLWNEVKWRKNRLTFSSSYDRRHHCHRVQGFPDLRSSWNL